MYIRPAFTQPKGLGSLYLLVQIQPLPGFISKGRDQGYLCCRRGNARQKGDSCHGVDFSIY